MTSTWIDSPEARPIRLLSILAILASALAPAAVPALMPAASPPARAGDAQPADLAFRNGRILTLDPAQPEATALAVRGDRIAAVGDWPAVVKTVSASTQIIDLEGRLLIPGLIESHAHLLSLGKARLRLDLVGTRSEEEIAALVRERAADTPPDLWIQGRGWDQNDWPTTDFPTAHSLTDAAPHHPVCLTRVDGHAVWVNGRAMDLAGLSAETPDPQGGRIERDDRGHPTGVLVDAAEELVTDLIPPLAGGQMRRALLLAIRECHELGITSLHDAGVDREEIALYRELLTEGNLTLRIYAMIDAAQQDLLEEYFARGPEIDVDQHMLTIRSIKLYADGALGSRGAALLEDYTDDPGTRGLIIDDEERIFAVASRALEHGFQVCTHAIGDRGNRVALNAYERAIKQHPEIRDHRFRVEHAQILDSADIPRFAALGVIPSMQPQHCTSDMPWVHGRIGSQRAAEGAYIWRSLLDTGVPIPGGSDAPVESPSPLWGIYAAITRQDRQGLPQGGWYPEQRMTRQEALESFTVHGAYASFEEDLKGTLEVGKLADLVVLSRDITSIPTREILGTEIVFTMVGGRIVYRQLE